MPKFRIQGRIYDVPTVEAAKALHRNYLAGGEVDPTEGTSTGQRILEGVGSGLMNVLRQTPNMILPDAMTPDWASDEAIAEQARLDAPLLKTGAGMAGRVGGEIAAAALPGGAAMKGARMLGAGGRVLPLAAGGATEGAILAGPGDRGAGAATGAALGGALGMIGRGARAATRPTLATGAQTLTDAGIDLMPGYARKGGVLKALEESAGGKLMPGVQDARQLNVDDTVRVMMRRAAPSRRAREAIELNRGKTTLDQDLNTLAESFNGVYANIKGYSVKPRSPDGQDLFTSVRNAVKKSSAYKSGKRKAMSKVDEVLDDLNAKRSSLMSDDLIKARSRIRAEIRRHQKGAQPDWDRIDALEAAEDALTDALESQLPGTAKMILRRADKQYSKYKTVEDIVYSRGDKGMTPSAIETGIKRAEDRLGGRSSTARGGDMTGFRDLSKAAADVFTETTKPTGMSLALPLATGSLAAGAGGGPVGFALGAGATGLIPGLTAVSRGMRRMATGNTAGQRALANTLDAINKPLEHIGQAGRVGALSYMNQE